MQMQGTRRSILQALWEARALSVDELAGRLRLSPMTVRHHLGVLEREGHITSISEAQRRRPGRPRLLFRLTPAGADSFPSNALQLADWLLAGLRDAAGAPPLKALLARVAEQAAAEFSPPSAASVAEKLDQIVAFLNNRGYRASWRIDEEGDGAYIVQTGPCPYRWIVQRHPELCELDRLLLTRLIGGMVERVADERPAGYRACAYRLIWPLAQRPPAQEQSHSSASQVAEN